MPGFICQAEHTANLLCFVQSIDKLHFDNFSATYLSINHILDILDNLQTFLRMVLGESQGFKRYNWQFGVWRKKWCKCIFLTCIDASYLHIALHCQEKCVICDIACLIHTTHTYTHTVVKLFFVPQKVCACCLDGIPCGLLNISHPYVCPLAVAQPALNAGSWYIWKKKLNMTGLRETKVLLRKQTHTSDTRTRSEYQHWNKDVANLLL